MPVRFNTSGGGGGADLDEVTARDVDVLAGKKIVDANGNVITGKMPDQGTKNYTLPINGTYTIPSGKHSGSGKVTQSIPVQGGSTIVPGTSNKTVVAANRYVNGNVIVSGDPNLRPENIKKGVTIFGVNGALDGVFAEDGDIYFEGKWAKSNSMTTRVYNGYMQFTAVNEGTSYLCRNNNNRNSYPAMGLLNPVNLSGITRVYIRFTAIGKYRIDLYINNVIGSDNDIMHSRVAYASMEPQVGQTATIEVDVSGLSGNHYITLLQNYVTDKPGDEAFRIHRIGTRI